MTYGEIITSAAGLMNDFRQTLYTNAVMLPFLNMSIVELSKVFQLNDIPITHETSDIIQVPAGIDKIGFNTVPTLPVGLTEIKQLFESVQDQNIWTPVIRRNFLTGLIVPATQLTYFGIWSWQGQAIRVPAAINIIDLKLDYIKSIAPKIQAGNLNQDNLAINTDDFLYMRTASFAALYIAENEGRAAELKSEAGAAIYTSLGISVKEQQSIQTRRRPFRASLRFNRWLS